MKTKFDIGQKVTARNLNYIVIRIEIDEIRRVRYLCLMEGKGFGAWYYEGELSAR